MKLKNAAFTSLELIFVFATLAGLTLLFFSYWQNDHSRSNSFQSQVTINKEQASIHKACRQPMDNRVDAADRLVCVIPAKNQQLPNKVGLF